jgi:hypothetical protein
MIACIMLLHPLPCSSGNQQGVQGVTSIDLQYRRHGSSVWKNAISIIEDRRFQENINDIRIGKVVRYIEKRWGPASLRLWVKKVGADGRIQYYAIPLTVSGE